VSGDQPPPPGWQPPQEVVSPRWGEAPGAPPGPATYPPQYQQPGSPPGYRPQQPYPGQPAGGFAVPIPVAHTPGAIPLRPLVLSDIFDGAFKIIRYNPRATIGAAVLVSAVAMIVPIAAGLATGSTGGFSPDPASGSVSDSQVVDLLVALGGLLAGAQLQAIGLLFVSGMIAHVSSAAAVGRKLTMAEAWAATRGKRWRLLGMSFLLGLGVLVVVGVAVGLVAIVALVFQAPLGEVVLFAVLLALVVFLAYVWFWVRLRALAVPTLMLEPVGVFGALRRAVRLTHHQFWRLLGLLVLVSLVVGVAGGILRLPFSIAGQLFLTTSTDTGYGLLIYLVLTAVGTTLSSAVLQPFSAAVSALLYIDQRIRKEAYDVELLGRAGILPA
jgi:hypothetical protein